MTGSTIIKHQTIGARHGAREERKTIIKELILELPTHVQIELLQWLEKQLGE